VVHSRDNKGVGMADEIKPPKNQFQFSQITIVGNNVHMNCVCLLSINKSYVTTWWYFLDGVATSQTLY